LLIIGILCRVPYVVQRYLTLPLNFIGKISYGIYIDNLPLLAIYRGGLRFVWGEEIFAGGVPWWTAFAAYLLILFVLSVMKLPLFRKLFPLEAGVFAERIASTQQVALNATDDRILSRCPAAPCCSMSAFRTGNTCQSA